MPQPGPIYDNAMKVLCERVPEALCHWLGIDIGKAHLTRLPETVPATAAKQVDALLAIGGDRVLHLELQSHPEDRYALRMLDYRLRIARRRDLRGRRIHQHVVMLGLGRIEEGIDEPDLSYRYPVHYLREQPVEPLLADPALSPLAVLADVAAGDRPAVLRRALDVIATVADDPLRLLLAQAAADLALLRLDSATIQLTWKDSAMPIPSFMNQLFEDGEKQGRVTERQEMLAAMLRHRYGADERIPQVVRRLELLSLDEVLDRIDAAASLDDL